jgi:hypothetical protein
MRAGFSGLWRCRLRKYADPDIRICRDFGMYRIPGSARRRLSVRARGNLYDEGLALAGRRSLTCQDEPISAGSQERTVRI